MRKEPDRGVGVNGWKNKHTKDLGGGDKFLRHLNNQYIVLSCSDIVVQIVDARNPMWNAKQVTDQRFKMNNLPYMWLMDVWLGSKRKSEASQKNRREWGRERVDSTTRIFSVRRFV